MKKHVSAAEFGDSWPLTVEEGYVYSVRKAAVFETEGKTYGLNGTAIS